MEVNTGEEPATNLQILSHVRPVTEDGRTGQTWPRANRKVRARQAVLFKVGACRMAPIPRMGLWTEALLCQGQSGEKPVRFVEHPPASGASSVATRGAGSGRRLPVRRQKRAVSEKLNDEPGIKPLLVSRIRDGAESAQ